MPTNKKKKGKGKKRASESSSAAVNDSSSSAATASVPNPRHLFRCQHNPAACSKCVLAYPPGCLHSLSQEERMSPAMNEIVKAFGEYIESGGNLNVLERPDFAQFCDQKMVRFIFSMTVKFILDKNSLFGPGNEVYKQLATAKFLLLLHVCGFIQCGSHAAAKRALGTSSPEDIALLDKKSQSYLLLYTTLKSMHHDSYARLVYILHELAPCACLEPELERTREQEGMMFMPCDNLCGTVEKSFDGDGSDKVGPLSYCSRCKMTVYCSPECQEDHWHGTSSLSSDNIVQVAGLWTAPHKIACKAIREFASFLRP